MFIAIITNTTPSNIRDMAIKSENLSLYAAAERLWNGEYVRIRGFRREISHWISILDYTASNNLDVQENKWLGDKNPGKFISYIERCLLAKKNLEQIATGLVSLEAIRFMVKRSTNEQIKILSSRFI